MEKEINPYVYFIERKDNRLWLMEKPVSKWDDYTLNPNEAKQFKTIQEADKYVDDNNLKEYCHVTEHLFIETLKL